MALVCSPDRIDPPYQTSNCVFTCFHYIPIEKNAPPTGGHVFSPIWTIFELVRNINKTNVLTNSHDDWANIVTSRPNKENCPPPRDINKTNVLTNFHDNWAKIVTSRVFTSHVFQLTGTIFELNSQIKATNVLTKFQDNWAKNVTSREFTCFHHIHIEKNALPTGGHTNILTNFELDLDFSWKKLLTKFHKDQTINVASRVFTNKCGRTTDGRTYDGQRPVTKAHLSNQVS
ncbi:hypothetical protein DPMN_105452 [Dreissena polymorpha]|uniref:Uncharacterized protein n=1 Tax=Dreissena polymorpha TaxID=45954 RepID=A0A9D4K2B1_DREPO|nr:hypothetical protein DPMN_105452 [Dreissena polymorpha]